MGHSAWVPSAYESRSVDRRAMSTNDVRSKVFSGSLHQSLNPFGVSVRESRDSEAHPESSAIGVFFDVTGSMGSIPAHFASHKLGGLVPMLSTKGVIAHPQVLFGAIGDSHSDSAPCQVGQFESGIEMDDCLTRVYIEGHGGGDVRESYGLAHYFFARHTSIDCFEKRGRKGYLFTLGDEMAHEVISPQEVRQIFGDQLQAPIHLRSLLAEVRERYHVFHFVVGGRSNHGNDPSIMRYWKELFDGKGVAKLDDPDNVCEMIAATVALNEGRGIDSVDETLVSAGVKPHTASEVLKALMPMFEQA
jgi:hypothetical protein